MICPIQRQLEARDARRIHAEDRFLARQEKREAAAEHLVGELNSGRCYINVLDRKGRMTGQQKYFDHHYQAISYLPRNNYV